MSDLIKVETLEEIEDKYNIFFIDLWGVVHNGVQLYPEAMDVLENLNKLKKRFVLLSNAPQTFKKCKKVSTR